MLFFSSHFFTFYNSHSAFTWVNCIFEWTCMKVGVVRTVEKMTGLRKCIENKQPNKRQGNISKILEGWDCPLVANI